MLNVVWIACGGGLGAALRYLLICALQRQPVAEGAWPWGTLTVNALGCLSIGVLGAWFGESTQVREELRLALFVGVLGGFTTYSAFGWDTFVLISRGHLAKAAAYVLTTTALAVLAVWVGYRTAERLGLAS